MKTRITLLTSLAVAATALAVSPASAQYAAYPDGREPAYNVTFYTDSTYTTAVGYQYPDCGFDRVIYSTPTGQQTDYGLNTLVGYCSVSGWEPV
jgi:hypothetical protein